MSFWPDPFFRLDGLGLGAARSKRLGFAVLWGSARVPGVVPTEDLAAEPAVVVRFAAGQLGVEASRLPPVPPLDPTSAKATPRSVSSRVRSGRRAAEARQRRAGAGRAGARRRRTTRR
ncbi:DUF4158 domain-containing protein [Kitasatospora sp. NPDC089797]|uniref:DUF4158 domain-containing protein n=1 Tax=Kitasatospora sp. NPDC089797 TaxID=3155298 RepID=UPI00343994FA